MPDGVDTQEETRILVTGVDERIQAAIDERIVDRADRQQPRPVQRMAQSGGAQQQKQVLLGDAEFDMLARGAHPPALHACHLGVAETRRCVYADRTGRDGSPRDPGSWTPLHPDWW